MAGKLRTVVLFLALASPALAQEVDANFQALLNALMQGTQVALLTPLPDGTLQVTSFAAPGQRSAAEAAGLIERARLNLANFGIEKPTGAQLAAALGGGTIEVPTGSTQIAGVLPMTAAPAQIRSQVVSATGLPQVVVPLSPGGVGQAGAGGSIPSSAALPSGGLAGLTSAQQTQALQSAHSQLAALGIANPTPQQVAAMLNGGTIATPAGTTMTLPGMLIGQPSPIVSPLPPSSTAVPSRATPTPNLR